MPIRTRASFRTKEFEIREVENGNLELTHPMMSRLYEEQALKHARTVEQKRKAGKASADRRSGITG